MDLRISKQGNLIERTGPNRAHRMVLDTAGFGDRTERKAIARAEMARLLPPTIAAGEPIGFVVPTFAEVAAELAARLRGRGVQATADGAVVMFVMFGTDGAQVPPHTIYEPGPWSAWLNVPNDGVVTSARHPMARKTFFNEQLTQRTEALRRAVNERIDNAIRNVPEGHRVAVGPIVWGDAGASLPEIRYLATGEDPPLGREWTVYETVGPGARAIIDHAAARLVP